MIINRTTDKNGFECIEVQPENFDEMILIMEAAIKDPIIKSSRMNSKRNERAMLIDNLKHIKNIETQKDFNNLIYWSFPGVPACPSQMKSSGQTWGEFLWQEAKRYGVELIK